MQDEVFTETSSDPKPVTSHVVWDRGFDLLDVFVALARGKRLIAYAALAAAIVTAIVVLLMPPMYTATTRILPPQKSQSTATALLGQLGFLAAGTTKDLGLKNPGDLYVGMLASRTVADSLIQRFHLLNVYHDNYAEDARKKLKDRTSAVADKNGIIVIEVDDRNPQRAADLANGYVDELQKLNSSLAITEAAQRRLFFQQQLDANKVALSNAEEALRKTQEKTGIVQPEIQGKGMVDVMARLQAEVAAKEVELQSMSLFATSENPNYQQAQKELAGLKQQLARLQRSSSDTTLPAIKNLPEASLEYVRRLRDVKYQESMFELLAKQYEAAKLDESKDSSIVQVLDPAIRPERRSSPRRGYSVIMAVLLGAFAAAAFCVVREGIRRLSLNPVHGSRFLVMQSEFGIPGSGK